MNDVQKPYAFLVEHFIDMFRRQNENCCNIMLSITSLPCGKIKSIKFQGVFFVINMNIKSYFKNIFKYIGLDIRRNLKSNGESNPFLAQKKLLKENQLPLIFDIGANIGQTAEEYLSLFENPQIYCFEPDPSTFGKLHELFQNDNKIKCHQLAFNDQAGVGDFFIMGENSGWSSMLQENPNSFTPKNMNSIKVNTSTVDLFCENNEIEYIDILKIDIQGAELKALQGAQTMLEQHKIRYIYTEADFADLYLDQSMFYDVAAFLHTFGYRTYGLYNLYYPEVNNDALMHGDAIFYIPSNNK